MVESAKAILIDTSGNGQMREPVLLEKLKIEEGRLKDSPKISDADTREDSQIEENDKSIKDEDEAEEADKHKCNKQLACGHKCHGVVDENSCMPCIDAECQEMYGAKQSGDELCAICYTSELQEEACVTLLCGHTFHADCVLKLLRHKWNTLKISFAFMNCPTCK